MKITYGAVPFLAALTMTAALGATGCGHRRPKVVVVEAAPAAPPPAAAPAPVLAGITMTGGQLDVVGDIEFDTGQATIRDTPGTRGVLALVLKVLTDNPIINRVRIEGHTDSDGTDANNQSLSERRAAAVAKFLIDHGIAPGRLNAVGCAARDPLVPNTSQENKQRNRRTELDVEQFDGRQPDGYTAACAPNAGRKHF